MDAMFLSGGTGVPSDAAVLVSILTVFAMIGIDVRLIRYCLDDLNRRPIVTGGDKRFWAAVIILGGPVGQICYWLYGRGEW